jgi:hypothetical protein
MFYLKRLVCIIALIQFSDNLVMADDELLDCRRRGSRPRSGLFEGYSFKTWGRNNENAAMEESPTQATRGSANEATKESAKNDYRTRMRNAYEAGKKPTNIHFSTPKAQTTEKDSFTIYADKKPTKKSDFKEVQPTQHKNKAKVRKNNPQSKVKKIVKSAPKATKKSVILKKKSIQKKANSSKGKPPQKRTKNR